MLTEHRVFTQALSLRHTHTQTRHPLTLHILVQIHFNVEKGLLCLLRSGLIQSEFTRANVCSKNRISPGYRFKYTSWTLWLHASCSCVHMCLREREREREGGRGREREMEGERERE